MPCPEKFRESLQKFQVDDSIVARIDEGFEDVVSRSPKKLRAAYFRRAMEILSECVEQRRLIDLMEWNACCKTGARDRASRAFAKENAERSLSERLESISAVANMGSPVLNDDGTITVHAVSYFRDGRYQCGCSQLSGLKRDYGVSRNYCFCCAGHFRYHYEIMLGVKLRALEIQSSPLDSDGKNPCVLRFGFAECGEESI